jgi:ribosomal protein L22
MLKKIYKDCSYATTTINIGFRKLNRVAKLIRNLTITEAQKRIAFTFVKGGYAMRKVLNSAIANDRVKNGLDTTPIVSKAIIEKKSILKRYRCGSHGRGMPIIKPICRICITLSRECKEGEVA